VHAACSAVLVFIVTALCLLSLLMTCSTSKLLRQTTTITMPKVSNHSPIRPQGAGGLSCRIDVHQRAAWMIGILWPNGLRRLGLRLVKSQRDASLEGMSESSDGSAGLGCPGQQDARMVASNILDFNRGVAKSRKARSLYGKSR
jgi:hypothetical protein